MGIEDLRIPDGADADHWAETSREYVRLGGLPPPPGTRVEHGCYLPEAAAPAGATATSGVIILAGSHRSGTSLLGRYLMASGVNVGKTLLGPLPSNPYGHFEDLELVQLHERSLA